MEPEEGSWEWFSKSHYVSWETPEDDEVEFEDDKVEFRKRIIQFWVEARTKDPNSKKKLTPFQALEELFEANKENPEIFMRVIEFTNRNRPKIWEDIEERPERDIVGLRAVIREWNKQRGDANIRDSLSELILSKQNLSSWPEFEAGALCNWVRRIRKGFKIDSKDVDFCYNILDRADRRIKVARESGRTAPNFATIPSEDFELMVLIQKCLTDSRLARPQDPKKIADFEKAMSAKFTSHGSDESQPWIPIFYWWALRIKFRRATSTLNPIGAHEAKKEMERVKDKMTTACQRYIDCLVYSSKDDNKKADESYADLVDYHGALVDFFPVIAEKDTQKRKKEGEKLWGNPSKKRNRKKGKLRRHEGKLLRYSTTSTTRKTNLFSDHTTTKIDGPDGTSIASKCRNSVRNANACCISIDARNSHQSATLLMLVSADLALRIRYFLSGARIKIWSFNSRERREREKTIASEIQGNLERTFSEVCDQLSEICDSPQTEIITIIRDWSEKLAILNLQIMAPQNKGEYNGPLWQLGEAMDSMVSCKEEEDNIKIISLKKEGLSLHFANKGEAMQEINGDKVVNPYIKPVGESPQVQ